MATTFPYKLTHRLALGIIFLSMSVTASAHGFTGVFHGQGTACSGALYVRAKTIQWNTSYSACGPTYYKIINNTLDDKPIKTKDHIVFSLRKPGKSCHWQVIALYYYSSNGGYPVKVGISKNYVAGPDWVVVGFPTLRDYQVDFPKILAGKPWPLSVLLCDLPDQKISY